MDWIENICKEIKKIDKEELGEDFLKDVQDKNSPQEIIIKPEALDTSNLIEGEGSKEYRPRTLEEYIGQKEAKKQILTELKGCKENNEPFSHTFISAPAGHGKTLLGEIIANMNNKKVIFTTGGELKSEQQFVDKINECNGGFILIDEANKINSKVGFFMLPTIEKFQIGNKQLNPFTCIFMTTHKGDLSKDLDALIQRCDLQLELNHYTNEELMIILQKYKEKQYPEKNVSSEIYFQIAQNSKSTPRIARKLLRKYIFNPNWEEVLEMCKIVKEGLTKQDIKVLRYLNSISGASKQQISSHLRIKPQTYEYDIESYLIFKEFIEITNKRKITEKGKEFLNEI